MKGACDKRNHGALNVWMSTCRAWLGMIECVCVTVLNGSFTPKVTLAFVANSKTILYSWPKSTLICDCRENSAKRIAVIIVYWDYNINIEQNKKFPVLKKSVNCIWYHYKTAYIM